MKKQKMLFFARLAVALVIGTLFVLGFCGVLKSFVSDLQLTPLFQSVLLRPTFFGITLLIVLLIITILFGRLYCSTLCPLGLFQELLLFALSPLRRLAKIKNSPEKPDVFACGLAIVLFASLLGGTCLLVRLADPYSIAGNVSSGAFYGIAFCIGLGFLVFFKARFFCAFLCPVGALLSVLAKRSLFKITLNAQSCKMCGVCAKTCPTASIDFKNKKVFNETCIKCLACLSNCKHGALKFEKPKKQAVPFNPDRRKFLVAGAALILVTTALKTGKELGKSFAKNLKNVLLPAGAKDKETFANTCLNCNLCVQNCPMKIIKPADSNFPAVHLDYQKNFCKYDCHKCSEVCPSGALEKLSLQEKQDMQIGQARLDEDVCVKCGLCVWECPREIISKEPGEFPVINAKQCIGCGACQSVCPVKAIKILPVNRQKILY